MSYQKSNGRVRRVFIVITEPNIADPAWVLPVTELKEGVSLATAKWPDDFICYSNGDELLSVAQAVRDKILENAAAHEATKKILTDLGMTFDDYLVKLREKHKKEAEAERLHQLQIEQMADEGNPHHD